MKRITPVHLFETGAAVSNLHKGLLFLIVGQGEISDNDRRSLQEQLAPEVKAESFGMATFGIVKTWQQMLNTHRDLPKDFPKLVENGDVDQNTANALNWLIRHLGAF